MITSGKSGFSPDGFLGGPNCPFTILNSCLVYIQFNDRLASVTGKGCYKSQGSLAQVLVPATETERDRKAGFGCHSCCLCLHCLIKSDKYIMVTSVHGRPGCGSRVTLVSGSTLELADFSSHGFTHHSAKITKLDSF